MVCISRLPVCVGVWTVVLLCDDGKSSVLVQAVQMIRRSGTAWVRSWAGSRTDRILVKSCKPYPCHSMIHRRGVGTGAIATKDSTDEGPHLVMSDADLVHSNPGIQALLDGYKTVIEKGHHSTGPSGDIESVSRAVFSNNQVDMGKVAVIGWDYDYTLVRYKQEMQELIYRLAMGRLVQELKYPQELLGLQYDPSFAIMGLAVDTEKGLLCKLSYINRVALPVYKGRRRLKLREVEDEYGYDRHVDPTYKATSLKPLNDRFCLAEACLLADVVEYLEANDLDYYPRAVVEDVLSSIRHVHVSEALHRAVVEDIAKYISPCENLKFILEQLRASGKQLFVCSNSPLYFVDAGMRHIMGPDWRDYFDLVSVSASKPHFYTSARPFRKISTKTGRIKWTKVDALERGQVYVHGSIDSLKKLKGWEGPRVLYFGDSLWADLVQARRMHGWTTGAIIYDVEEELRAQASEEYQRDAFHAKVLEVLLHLVQDHMEGQTVPRIGHERTKEDDVLLDLLEERRRQVKIAISRMSNKNFGSIFRAEGEPTLFAFSLWRFVDLYTSRVSNLKFYGATHRFYPTHSLQVAHELKLSSREIRAALLQSLNEVQASGPETAAEPAANTDHIGRDIATSRVQ